jgi:hypothetical protein
MGYHYKGSCSGKFNTLSFDKFREHSGIGSDVSFKNVNYELTQHLPWPIIVSVWDLSVILCFSLQNGFLMVFNLAI